MLRSVLLPISLCICLGCGSNVKAPQIVPVMVTVKLDGQPLPNAFVKLALTSSNVTGSGTATGVTDDSGKATLTIDGKPGACVGSNAVAVTEAPEEHPPSDAPRDLDKRTPERKQNKNRPIPAKYANAINSGVTVDVKEGQTEYTIELQRDAGDRGQPRGR